jgi:hypothetical protein
MALADSIRMQICPNCAKERDDGDLLCVHCGHLAIPAATMPAPRLVAPPAALVPAPRPAQVVGQSKRNTRNVFLGVVAIGVAVAVVVFVMRSRGRESQENAAAAAPPANASAPAAVRKSVASVAAPVESEPAAAPKWKRTRQSRWATDGSPTMGFEVQAERDVTVYMGRVRPVLAVRCVSRYTEVFIVLQSSASIENAGDAHTVMISLDGEPAVEQHWVDSTDKQALFAPDGEALAARMAASRRLHFSFKPFNAAPATAEFDVHGFDEPLAALSKTCRNSAGSASTGSTRAARRGGL